MITWTASNMNTLRIDFSSDNGQSWQTIAASVPANLGKYEWLVPETPSSQCFIKVTDLEDGSISSTNQLPFNIPVPTLTMELLPADLYANTVHTIRWKSESVTRINIYFAAMDGPWKAIAENADAQLGYFNWAVSDSLPVIRIKVASASDTTLNVVEGVVSVSSLPGGNL
jgi:hypothetical protein